MMRATISSATSTVLPDKLCSLAIITLSSIPAVDLCYPYVTMLVSDPILVYLADIYSLIPHPITCCLFIVGLASHSCMLRSVVASLSILCFTCLV